MADSYRKPLLALTPTKGRLLLLAPAPTAFSFGSLYAQLTCSTGESQRVRPCKWEALRKKASGGEKALPGGAIR